MTVEFAQNFHQKDTNAIISLRLTDFSQITLLDYVGGGIPGSRRRVYARWQTLCTPRSLHLTLPTVRFYAIFTTSFLAGRILPLVMLLGQPSNLAWTDREPDAEYAYDDKCDVLPTRSIQRLIRVHFERQQLAQAQLRLGLRVKGSGLRISDQGFWDSLEGFSTPPKARKRETNERSTNIQDQREHVWTTIESVSSACTGNWSRPRPLVSTFRGSSSPTPSCVWNWGCRVQGTRCRGQD